MVSRYSAGLRLSWHQPSALVHMVIQTGPILPQVSGKLLAAARQLQGQKDGPQYILGHSPAAIGAKIGRAIVGQLVNHCNFWILLRHIQPQVWIALIVFQEDVVLRQIPLDEGALQNQGFKLRRCNNDVKMVNFDTIALVFGVWAAES